MDSKNNYIVKFTLAILILFPEYHDRFYNPLGGCTEDERQRGNSTGIYWTEGNEQVHVLCISFTVICSVPWYPEHIMFSSYIHLSVNAQRTLVFGVII